MLEGGHEPRCCCCCAGVQRRGRPPPQAPASPPGSACLVQAGRSHAGRPVGRPALSLLCTATCTRDANLPLLPHGRRGRTCPSHALHSLRARSHPALPPVLPAPACAVPLRPGGGGRTTTTTATTTSQHGHLPPPLATNTSHHGHRHHRRCSPPPATAHCCFQALKLLLEKERHPDVMFIEGRTPVSHLLAPRLLAGWFGGVWPVGVGGGVGAERAASVASSCTVMGGRDVSERVLRAALRERSPAPRAVC